MLRITKSVLDRIIDHARWAAPEEACGVLGGLDDKALQFYPVTNKLHSPTEYFMEPVEQLKAYKEILGQGLELVAIYHSHPASQAVPSVHDLNMAYDSERKEAYYPGARYLIVSLREPNHPQVRCWALVEGRFVEEEIQVEG